MHPCRARQPFRRDGWVYERKEGGWRMLAYKEDSRVRLLSCHGVAHTARFRDVTAAIGHLPARTLIVDGEVCVFDAQLVSHIHLLDLGEDVTTPPAFMGTACTSAGARGTGQGDEGSGARPGSLSSGSTAAPCYSRRVEVGSSCTSAAWSGA